MLRRQQPQGRVELVVFNVEGQPAPLIEIINGAGVAVVFRSPRANHMEVPRPPKTELALERDQLEQGPVSVNLDGLHEPDGSSNENPDDTAIVVNPETCLLWRIHQDTLPAKIANDSKTARLVGRTLVGCALSLS